MTLARWKKVGVLNRKSEDRLCREDRERSWSFSLWSGWGRIGVEIEWLVRVFLILDSTHRKMGCFGIGHVKEPRLIMPKRPDSHHLIRIHCIKSVVKIATLKEENSFCKKKLRSLHMNRDREQAMSNWDGYVNVTCACSTSGRMTEAVWHCDAGEYQVCAGVVF